MPLAAIHIQAQQGHAQACPQVQIPRVARENSVWIVAFTESSVYRGPISAQQQIRPVPLGLLQGGGAPPIRNLRVIAPNQHLRHLPPAKIRRPRVMRKIQKGARFDSGSITCRGEVCRALFSGIQMPHLAERFILRRSFVPERSRNEARSGIDDQHRRKFPAAKHVISNGNFFRGKIFGDALVDSLIPPAKKNNAVQLRIPSRGFLPKEVSGRRHQNDGRLRSERSWLLGASQAVPKQRFDRLKERLRLKHHPFAPAKRPVIDAAMPILGKHPQVLYVNLDEACLASAPENTVIQRPGKKFRKNGNQIEAHRCCQSNVPVCFADIACHSNAGSLP
jgi:hypothetical protein